MKKLQSIRFVFGIMDEFNDCTYCCALVYSYLLCKYQWFSSKGQDFFESQATIAESCRSKQSSVKLAIKFLTERNVVKVLKGKGYGNNNNVYVVEDRYKIYNNPDKVLDQFLPF